MAGYLKKRPMLFCAAVSAVLCIVGFYCPPAVFFCGIALIILFFVSLYLRRPAETVVAFILAVTAAGILLTSSRAAELSGLDGSVAKGEFTVVSEPENTALPTLWNWKRQAAIPSKEAQSLFAPITASPRLNTAIAFKRPFPCRSFHWERRKDPIIRRGYFFAASFGISGSKKETTTPCCKR